MADAGQQWFNPTVNNASITAEYAQLPRNPNTTWRAYGKHTGVDYGVKENSPAYAISGGRVVKAGFDKGVGNYVTLETAPGRQVTYQHLNKIGVKAGQSVTGGYQLGATGNTGSLSQGAHLHTEYSINGKLVSPSNFFGKSMPSWVKESKGAPSVLGKSINYGSGTPSAISGSTQFSGVGSTGTRYTSASTNVFGKIF